MKVTIEARRRHLSAGAIAAFCWAIGPGVAYAVTVHTWVDAEGTTHFSDQAPAADTASEVFDIATSEPVDAAEDYYSISNQWARLRAERDASDARALERQRLRAEAAAAAAPPPVPEVIREGAIIGPYGFGGGGYGYPQHPHRRHRQFPIDRDAYLDSRRRTDFIPIPAPDWPRQR